uniref:Uncharacterized protein hmd47 n=1 Tax=Haloferax mediterranei TaxID=2252 RepID=Q9HHC1_HALME|nr:unknown [Haloferax mediterranei ATCC 33500]
MAAVVGNEVRCGRPVTDGANVDDAVRKGSEHDVVRTERWQRLLCVVNRPNESRRDIIRGVGDFGSEFQSAEVLAGDTAGNERFRRRKSDEEREQKSVESRSRHSPPRTQEDVSDREVEMGRDETAGAVTEDEVDVAVDYVGPNWVHVLAVEVPPVRRKFDGVDVIPVVREPVDEPLDALMSRFVSPPEDEQEVVVDGVTVLGDPDGRTVPAWTESHDVVMVR